MAGASGVIIFPYLNVYLAQRGLSSSQIGLLSALRPWMAAPASMAASALADRYKLHTQLLVGLGAVSVLLRSSLPLAASVPLPVGASHSSQARPRATTASSSATAALRVARTNGAGAAAASGGEDSDSEGTAGMIDG